jgi:hypothetical protein
MVFIVCFRCHPVESVIVAGKDMPASLKTNWEIIQSLYVNGVTCPRIAEQFGINVDTIRKRVAREGWVALRAKVIDDPRQADLAQESSLSTASMILKKSMARSLVRAARLLDGTKVGTLKDMNKLQAELSPTIRNATVVFGWDKETTEPMVRVSILRQLSSLPSVLPSQSSGSLQLSAEAEPSVPVSSLPDVGSIGEPKRKTSMLSDPSDGLVEGRTLLLGSGDQISKLSEKIPVSSVSKVSEKNLDNSLPMVRPVPVPVPEQVLLLPMVKGKDKKAAGSGQTESPSLSEGEGTQNNTGG